MPAGDRELVEEARRAVARAYAPYSKFRVGAAARLRSGKILCRRFVARQIKRVGHGEAMATGDGEAGEQEVNISGAVWR